MSSNGCGFAPSHAGPMLRLLRNCSRVQDWSAWSRLLARTFVVEPRRLLEIDRNGPVSLYSSCSVFSKVGGVPAQAHFLVQLGRVLF